MKSPAFWQDPGAPLGRLLAPLGWAYAGTTAWRLAHGRPWTAPVPVICVGNLTAGGAGKTPIVRDLARRLKAAGWNVGILSRGYGGTEHGPLRVDPALHGADAIGDEPLLLARDAPCWIARDRAAGAKTMADKGVEVILMDDGLQNPSLAKDLSIIVADGATGFGNGRAIPAGPLRETIEAGIRRADALIVTGDDKCGLLEEFSPEIKTLQTAVTVRENLPAGPLLAFAGIGRPGKFRATLTEAGADIAAFQAFADHHAYSATELAALAERARALGAELVTTEKDWVRLNGEWRRRIKAIGIDVVWGDEAGIAALLQRFAGHG
ncbi:MAG TPA: tetraacyldisaccharide 4'-kinase [Alphaproteobacteria bacterium]|nr:tetraacyldisaccharide 4'-kinase [Alphaproteobacteria bacterium]